MCLFVKNAQVNNQKNDDYYGKYAKKNSLSLIVISEQGENEHFARYEFNCKKRWYPFKLIENHAFEICIAANIT